MQTNLIKILLDSNVLISAVVYGGKPEEILNLVYERQLLAATSPILISELFEVLTKKFKFSTNRLKYLENKIKKNFEIIHPTITIDVQKDKDDNRVLEAAVEGKCHFIITGDKELLDLAVYKKIKIIIPDEFLKLLYK